LSKRKRRLNQCNRRDYRRVRGAHVRKQYGGIRPRQSQSAISKGTTEEQPGTEGVFKILLINGKRPQSRRERNDMLKERKGEKTKLQEIRKNSRPPPKVQRRWEWKKKDRS